MRGVGGRFAVANALQLRHWRKKGMGVVVIERWGSKAGQTSAKDSSTAVASQYQYHTALVGLVKSKLSSAELGHVLRLFNHSAATVELQRAWLSAVVGPAGVLSALTDRQ